MDLVKFVTLAVQHDGVKALVQSHGLTLSPNLTVGEVVAVLKLVCAGASVACPIVDSLSQV